MLKWVVFACGSDGGQFDVLLALSSVDWGQSVFVARRGVSLAFSLIFGSFTSSLTSWGLLIELNVVSLVSLRAHFEASLNSYGVVQRPLHVRIVESGSTAL